MTRLALVGLVVVAIAPVSAEDWPQFRGPNCSGVSNTKASLPTHFSETEHVKWSAKLGDGIGSPVVASGRGGWVRAPRSPPVDDETSPVSIPQWAAKRRGGTVGNILRAVGIDRFVGRRISVME